MPMDYIWVMTLYAVAANLACSDSNAVIVQTTRIWGLKKSVRLVLGILSGHTLLVVTVFSVGFAGLYERYMAMEIIRLISVLFLIILAYQAVNEKPEPVTQHQTFRPDYLWGLVFHLSQIRVWMSAVVAVTAFLNIECYQSQLVICATLYWLATAILLIFCFVFSCRLSGFMANKERHYRFNIVMASFLIFVMACVVKILTISFTKGYGVWLAVLILSAGDEMPAPNVDRVISLIEKFI